MLKFRSTKQSSMNKIILLFLTLILVASPVFAQQEPVAQPDSVTHIT